MTEFSLSRARSKVVPESMTLPDGREVAVNADFRVVLKCLRTLKNRDLTDAQKEALISLYFFNGLGVLNPSRLFLSFLDDGKAHDDSGEQVVDFEQDSDAIYASFLSEYGIDLIDVGFLHWNKFKVLYGCLGGENALSRRVHIRTMDTSKLKGKEKAAAEKAKRAVALDQTPCSKEEARLQKALDDALAEGRDPSEAVKALNDYYSKQGGES